MRTDDVPSEVPKHHLHNLLFRNIPLEQQGDRLGYRPPILAEQPFPQQAKVFVSTFVPGVSGLNPNLVLAHLNAERFEIVAFIIKATAALQIETPAVPVARENTAPDDPTSQGVTHVGALVIGRIDPSINVEQRDAAPVTEPDGFRSTDGNIAECGHMCPLRFSSCHNRFSPSGRTVRSLRSTLSRK